MDELVKKLQHLNEQHQFWKNTDCVLLAISGGVDSMALLDAFHHLPPESKPHLAVLHVHHHLRKEADEDCVLVEKYCQEHGVPVYVKHWDKAAHPNQNIEATARTFRYQFFQEKLEELNATTLVTAHHADDQMETILMRLARGSTLKGYTGIQLERPFAHGKLIRPFLETEKDHLYDYCYRKNIPFREDETNEDLIFTRNRFRHQVAPLIKKENQQASRHFQEFSDDLTTLLEVVEPLLKTAFKTCFKKEKDVWYLQIDAFLKSDPPIRRLVLSYFLDAIWQEEGVSVQRSHIEDVLTLIESHVPQGDLHLSGGQVKKRYGLVLFEKTNQKQIFTKFKEELSLNEWLDLPFNGKIGLFLPSGKENDGIVNFFCDKETIQLPLIVRSWLPGDRIQLNRKNPFTKKVARIFIDNKIPLEERERALVVADARGTILLVPGYALSRWVIKESLLSGGEIKEVNLLQIAINNNEVTM